MSRRRQAGVLGLVVTGLAAGLVVERYAVGRTRLRADPGAQEPFFALPADRTRTVVADDGVPLHVEEVGAEDAPLTLVLCHGYTQQLAVWHFQRQEVGDELGRLVLWDQRSHGRSGRSSPERSTIDQLGHDLASVLEACVPRGPVVLVGHSMGGMTIMALADQHPELFADRVAGVLLLGTSAGRLSELTFGLPATLTPVTRRALPWLTRGVRRRPGVFERSRRLGTEVGFLVARRMAFGSTDVSPALVEFVERMTAECPVEVIAEFYDTFTSHDKLAALSALADLPVTVVVGSRDLLTPEAHSRAIAEALPSAELVVAEGAGHMVQLEQPELVTAALRALVARVAAAAGGADGVSARGGPDEAARAVTAAALAAPDWDAVAAAARTCTACPELAATRTSVVVGARPPGARLLVLGEAPGAQEDETGLPFVGRSGQLLDLLLAEAGGNRARTAVLNTLKCRPPGNRPPTRTESAHCRGWTERQLDLAAPELVVTLGLSATRWFLGPVALGAVRGQVHEVGGRRVLPTYHPSAALRHGPQGEPRRLLGEDLALAVRLTADAA